jgi:hypothetical protein
VSVKCVACEAISPTTINADMISIAGRDTGLTRDCSKNADHPPSNRLKRIVSRPLERVEL